MKSQQLASALVAVFRLLHDAPSEGRRRLFEAVNEAFCYVATVQLVSELLREGDIVELRQGYQVYADMIKPDAIQPVGRAKRSWIEPVAADKAGK